LTAALAAACVDPCFTHAAKFCLKTQLKGSAMPNTPKTKLNIIKPQLVEPGGWIYKDTSVKMDTTPQKLTSGLFGSAGGNLCWNRFTGPGRVALQSMSVHLPGE
jgi:hypothetical protein